MRRASPLTREAVLAGSAAAAIASLLAWIGPPGTDLAAHIYLRDLFVHHGFALWDNLWYAGRYAFVTYSVLYYPLAALVGIKLLGVVSIAVAATAFSVVVGREWGPPGRWAGRAFALVWPGIVLTAAYPYALGAAFALLALLALQARRRWIFAFLALLTLAGSPLAFVLLAIVLAGVGLARRRLPVVPATALALAAAAELVLLRIFPGGRYPFTVWSLLGVLAFCLAGVALAWRNELLRWLLGVYLAVCVVVFAIPSGLGSNVVRLREAALPLAVLMLALRRRPLWLAVPVLALAAAWNVEPYVRDYLRNDSDHTESAAFWQPAIGFLRAHLPPSYRVEAVDTTGHWSALYLPRAGIPIVRGWFRQDDYPANELLDHPLSRSAYVDWLHRLGVRYVVKTSAPSDYSARREARIVPTLTPAFRARGLTIYSVPDPQPIVTGPGRPRVIALRRESVLLSLAEPGTYRVAVRYSPYWRGSNGACVRKAPGDAIDVTVRRAGPVALRSDVGLGRAWDTLIGASPGRCR